MNDKTLPQIVQQAAQQFGSRTAIEDGELRFSYTELEEARLQAARAFLALGIGKGDRIAIWAPNMYEWVIASIGLQSLGAVLVPLNTRMKGPEAAFILQASGARLLLTVGDFLGVNYPELLKQEDLPALERIIMFRGEADDTLAWPDFLVLGNDIPEAMAEASAAAVTPDDTLDLMFTSGTTGNPKGVMTSHGQNIKVFETWSAMVGLTEHDNYLVINPFFHSFGYKAGWLASIIRGAKILPVQVFELDSVLERIEKDRVSVLPGAPTIYQSLLAHPRRSNYDTSSLRLAVTGAAPVSVELVTRMRTELGFETVLTAYGLTETCGVVSICREADGPEIISTTSGRAITGVEVRCVAEAGKDAATGEAGEIYVRGYNVMQGYLGDPEATAEAIDADGWLHTGDVGVMDADGYLRITDRIKDMFIVGGFNCYPAEIEGALGALHSIAQVAVIGVSDERLGEVAKAFVVRTEGAELSAEEVTEWCRANMANYKVPRYVEFVAALPLNASGKVLKTELRAGA